MNRAIPLHIKLVIYFRASVIVGLIITILGIWLCMHFISVEELLAEKRLKEVSNRTKGIIMKRWDADWAEDGRIISSGYDYYFIHPMLGQLTNTSFSRRTSLSAGDTVSVIYDEGNPYISKIEDMNYTATNAGILWLPFIPLAGFAILLYGIRKVRKYNHLLRKGIFVWGDFIRHEKTGVFINESHQYRLYYQYQAHGTEILQGSITTTNTSDFDNKELIIYESRNPKNMILLYALPYIAANYIEEHWEEVQHVKNMP